MDLNKSNKTNELASTLTTVTSLIKSTNLDDINIGNIIIGENSNNSIQTSAISTAVHVELPQSTENLLDIHDGEAATDIGNSTYNENNEDDKLIVKILDSSQPDSETKSFEVQTKTSLSPSPIDPTVSNKESLVIDTADNSPVRSTLVHVRSNPGDSKRVRFKKSIVGPTSDHDSRSEITIIGSPSNSGLERVTTTTTNILSDLDKQTTRNICDVHHDSNLENIELNESTTCIKDYDDYDDHLNNDEDELNTESFIRDNRVFAIKSSTNQGKHSSNLRKPSYFGRIYNRLTNITLLRNKPNSRLYRYSRYENDDLLEGSERYTNSDKIKSSRTFRGGYKYSNRSEIRMAVFRKSINLLSLKSTYALLGAFLIHVTLGTVYTLSNVNSYMTSYMREHGSPHATYGAAVWLSSSYSVGQGISMVLGGYLEKRFSARLSCIIGCAIHSISIMSTSWTINYGILPVLLSYGILPGFGCGLAYMTPMSNGFAWFPNRRGLVAGVILAGFGIGTFVFNMAQTGFVNPSNLSPLPNDNGYFKQKEVLDRVPHLFTFLGSIYALMQLVGCTLLFPPPRNFVSDERPMVGDSHSELDIRSAIKTPEFKVLFIVYGLTTQGVLFINSILKEYGQIFIQDDSYLAWVGSMASIANSLGRLIWGLAIDKYSFTFCFTCITIIFTSGLFLTPFKFILSSKLLYLLCTLVMFGSFSGWMSSFPVHLSRVFGRTNSGMIYGLIYISQAIGGVLTAFGTHYLIDNYDRFVPFYCICSMELVGLLIYVIYYPKHMTH